MTEVLSARDLSAGYDGGPVISGLNFSVSDGDVLAVLGPNGSGKTTLLRAVLGLMPVKSGSVSFFGEAGFEGAGLREDLVAYIPQRMEMDRTFPITLGEMLALSRRTKGLARWLKVLELEGLMDKRVGDLSGGQMQRALLAYAIIKEPRLIIMDEPTSWVDAKGADCVFCIIEELKHKGIAMVIVSHDFQALRGVSTHVLGLGLEPGSQFFAAVDDPKLEGLIISLFGTLHHADPEGHLCTLCGLSHDIHPEPQGGGGTGKEAR